MRADASIRAARFAAAAMLAVAAGCRTVDDVITDYRAGIAAGNYAACAKEPAELAAEEGGDRLMWRLMSATAYDLAGETDKAIADFDFAEDIMIENDKSSVFSRGVDTANAMMLSDKYFPYDGGGQDRIFTCMYKAVAYGTKGDFTAARTELNRASQHQENWLWERRKNLAAAEERLQKDSKSYSKENGGEDNEGQSNVAIQNAVKDGSFRQTVKEAFGVDIFSSSTLDDLKPADYQNPYLSHVCGIFRWLDGDGDGRGYLRDANRLRPGNSVVKSDLESCGAGKKPSGQVWIYAEDGLGPRREKWRIDLPLGLIPYAGKYVVYAGLALPRLLEMPAAANSWNAGGVAMEELASVESLMKVEYDVYMRGAIRREITRTIVDVGIQAALGIAAEHANDNRAKYALIASQYAVAGYSAIRRGADTREWASLPKRVFVARVARPADGVVKITADGQNVAEVVLPEGNAMVFVRKPGPLAAASVKVVKFP